MQRALTVLVWIVVLALAAVTAIANFRFGFLVTTGEERYVYAIGGTLLDVVKTFLPTIMGTFLVGPLTPGTFFRHVAGWSIWTLGVVWSIICALGLYSIAKEARVGDVKGAQATYQQLTAEQTTKQARLTALATIKTREAIEGGIAARKRDRLWTRTKDCADATATESRTFCAEIDTMTASLAMAPIASDVTSEASRLRSDVKTIEVKLAGMNMSAVLERADPATDALVDLTSWPAETVKSRMALLLALLFEGGGLLLWITTGGHGKRPPVEHDQPVMRKKSRNVDMSLPISRETPDVVAEQPAEAKPLDLPEDDGVVAQWAKSALVRRKGSFTPASDVRSDFETWCRAHGHEAMNTTAFGKQMTVLGFDRKKVGGNQRYVDIALLPKSRDLKLVASN